MSSVLDKHALTVAEVSALTGLSRQTVTRIFEKERGVISLERPRVEAMHKTKRVYRTIRIPRTVYERVIGRLAVR
jgi:predicted DNA-binding transcriptional regulator AlpA